MSSPVEQIKEKLEVAEFLKGYLELRPAGKNFKALCPFHGEKSPSFMVSPDRGTWHCFGCNLGGDVFSFIMRYENLEFSEALKVLAEKAGIELQRINPAEYKLFGLLYDLNDIAKNFFIKELANSPVAQKYLKDRGLTEDTIKEFEIGFAPNSPEALNLHFLNSNYRPDDVLRAGLAFKTEKGTQLDRFRGRIMFPIKNNVGKTVGFTGRVLPEFDTGQMGKYVNSPETPIFVKSKILYGFDKSKEFIRSTKSAFLVEGQMDLIMSWQSGVRNVVASSGTALTPDHLRILKRLTDTLILSFDTDDAGFAAGERAIDLAEAMDFNIKVVVFNNYKDAAEAAQADPGNLAKAISEAIPATKFYFKKYLVFPDSFSSGNREHLRNLRVVLAKIKNLASPVEQSFWMNELSAHVNVPEKTLLQESEKLAHPTESPRADSGDKTEISLPARNFSRRDVVSQRLLSAIFQTGDFAQIGECVSFLNPDYQSILEILKRGEKNSPDPNLDSLINFILLRSGESAPNELVDLKKNLFSEYIKEERQRIAEKIKRADTLKDEIALAEAMAELGELSSQKLTEDEKIQIQA